MPGKDKKMRMMYNEGKEVKRKPMRMGTRYGYFDGGVASAMKTQKPQ
tara:strand:- start:1222 stop:1362 length:141 start_codon:yes stop_codon:yes gene_type:complete